MSGPCTKHQGVNVIDAPCLMCLMASTVHLQQIVVLALAWRAATKDYLRVKNRRDRVNGRGISTWSQAQTHMQRCGIALQKALDAELEQQEALG